ncbi:MAG TPA: TIGR03546 family protein [Planctomycetota bacterium]
MLALRFVVRFVKLLNSETSSTALGLALALGLFLGFVPIATPQALAAVAVLLFFRVNVTAALVMLGAAKLLALALGPAFDALGVALLESDALTGLWTSIYDSPLYLCRLHHSVTLGGTVAGLALLLPVFLLARRLIDLYRRRVNEKLAQSSVLGLWRSSRLYQLYTRIDSPYMG